MKYIVEKREVHTVKVEVEADYPLEALKRVQDGLGVEVEREYLDSVDPYGLGTMNVYEWWVTDDKGISKPISQL